MRDFTNIIKHSLLRLATVLSALLVGVTFALTTSVASAGEINRVVIVKPKAAENVLPAIKVLVFPPAKQIVKPEAPSQGVRMPGPGNVGFRRFGFIAPFGFRPVGPLNSDADFD